MKVSKPIFADEKVSLEDLINQQGIALTQGQIISAFCNDLKGLLQFDDINMLIQEIFAVEHRLGVINEVEDDMELPELGDFYQNLSPILLRALLESDGQQIIKGWKEAIRIAIEEELYCWKEKLFN